MSFTSVKILIFYFVLAIYQLMKSTGFFDYAKYLQLKTENCTSILRYFFKPFPCQICYIFSCPVAFLPFEIFDLLLYTSSSLTKALSIRKALSMKQFIKASVRTRTFLVEFFWEVQLNFTIKLLSFCTFYAIFWYQHLYNL